MIPAKELSMSWCVTPAVVRSIRTSDPKLADRLQRAFDLGRVQILAKPDESYCLDDIEGDCFKPELHPDIPAERILAERDELHRRVDREGVWGLVGQYASNGRWITADSCWGFVGEDYIGSDYDHDVASITLDQLDAYEARRCPHCNGTGELESTRIA